MKKLFFLFTIFVLIFSYHNSYSQWVRVNGLYNNITSFAMSGSNIFAGDYIGRIFLSTNSGTDFSSIQGVPGLVNSFTVNGTNIFAGCLQLGIYLSTDNGTNWNTVNNGLSSLSVYDLAVKGSNIYAGTSNGVYISTNNGTLWSLNGLPGQTISILNVNGPNIFAVGFAIIYLSTNNGTNWNQTAGYGLPEKNSITAFTSNGNNIFLAPHYANIYHGIYLSTNNGNNWASVNNGLTNFYVYTLAASGANIFAGTGSGAQGGVFLSTNNGTNWSIINDGLQYLYINVLAILGSYIYESGEGGVWRRPLSELIGISVISSQVPQKYSLSQNYPNPFNPSTKIKFAIPGSSPLSFGEGLGVGLSVYDLLGREVETLVNEQLKPGTYEVDFDGSKFSSGIYFYTIQTENFTDTKRMILIK